MTVEVTYVLGLGRSGSTVFGRALADALDATPGDELMAVWQRGFLEDRACSCGVAFSRCQYWSDVVSTAPALFDVETAARVVSEIHRVMKASGPRRVLTPRSRATLVESMPPFWFEAVAALYRGVGLVGGGASIVDTSKAPVLGWLLSHCPGIRVRSVLLVRDPRDVARSWSHPPKVPADAHELPVLAPWQTAIVWLGCNAASLRVHDALGGSRQLILRFEDFVEDPAHVVKEAARLLSETQPRTGGARHDVHTMSGHPSVRFGSGEIVVRAGPATQSRGISDRLVELIDAPLLNRFGYSAARTT